MSLTFKSTGLTLSRLGFGAMGITAFYNTKISDEDALTLLSKVHSLGVSHFDTAEVYKTGNFMEDAEGDQYNESVLGKFFSSLPRESFTVATKFHPYRHSGDCSFESVSAALDASLNRLGLSYVDVYYCHRMPNTWEALESWMHSVKKLVAAGKIRHVGLSEVGPAWLRRAFAIHPIACIQQEWSAATRILEDVLVPVCAELGIGIVAYSPLARNLLTASAAAQPPSAEDWRSSNPRFQGENFEKNKIVAAKIGELSVRVSATPAQLCLAWLYRRAAELGVQVVPIPGSTKIENVVANAGALNVTLADAEYAELTELASQIAGPRSADQYAQMALEGQLAKQ